MAHNIVFNECQDIKSFLVPERITSYQLFSLAGPAEYLREAFSRYVLLLDDNRKSVMGICEGFEGRLEIPEGIERIKKCAFENSKISSVELPKTLKYIGESAFANCHNLYSITIPNSVEFISNKAFFGCVSLSGEIILPLSDIREYSFYGCPNIASIRYPEAVSCACRNCKRASFHRIENSIGLAAIVNPSILQELSGQIHSFFSRLGESFHAAFFELHSH